MSASSLLFLRTIGRLTYINAELIDDISVNIDEAALSVIGQTRLFECAEQRATVFRTLILCVLRSPLSIPAQKGASSRRKTGPLALL